MELFFSKIFQVNSTSLPSVHHISQLIMFICIISLSQKEIHALQIWEKTFCQHSFYFHFQILCNLLWSNFLILIFLHIEIFCRVCITKSYIMCHVLVVIVIVLIRKTLQFCQIRSPNNIFAIVQCILYQFVKSLHKRVSYGGSQYSIIQILWIVEVKHWLL